MPAEIVSLKGMPQSARQEALRQAEDIFFATAATQSFASAAEREAFRTRWFFRYAALQPGAFLIARDTDRSVLGYLAGCFDTFGEESRSIACDIAYYTPRLSTALSPYPSHFHINVKPGRQGQGIGGALVKEFLAACREAGACGAHVVTGVASPAVKFYLSCSFRLLDGLPEANPRLAFLARATVPPHEPT